MTIENGARGVRNRVVIMVLTFGEHSVKGRDRSAAGQAIAGTLHELWQPREHRRRVAFGGGCLADGEADLALRLREAREGIHQQQDVLATVAKIFGNGGGEPSA